VSWFVKEPPSDYESKWLVSSAVKFRVPKLQASASREQLKNLCSATSTRRCRCCHKPRRARGPCDWQLASRGLTSNANPPNSVARSKCAADR
jgi:hypothetical protein